MRLPDWMEIAIEDALTGATVIIALTIVIFLMGSPFVLEHFGHPISACVWGFLLLSFLIGQVMRGRG